MKKYTPYMLTVLVVLLAAVAVMLCWEGEFSSSTASMRTRNDSSKETSQNRGTKSEGDSKETSSEESEEDATLFEEVVELGTGSLALRSQHVVANWSRNPLTVFTDGGYIYVSDINGVRSPVARLEQGAGSPTLAAHDGVAVVAWVTKDAIVPSSSTDLVEWSEPILVGNREQEGGPIPSIDWTGTEFAVAWVDAPKTNTATGAMDGVGTLQLAKGDGVNGWTMESINQTTTMVSIAGSTLVWRDDRSESGSLFDTIRMQDIYEGEEVVVCPGYDPAVAVNGKSIAIGYHLGSEAHLRTSKDGGASWEDEVLDSTGKFVAPLAFGGKFGAVWVDYTDADAAANARDDAGHRTSVIWDGEAYSMNDGAGYTLQGQGTVVNGTPAVVYQVDGKIFLAR